jgi:hypothetical protein
MTRSANGFDELAGPHLQAAGQLHDVEQTYVPFAALYTADVVAM